MDERRYFLALPRKSRSVRLQQVLRPRGAPDKETFASSERSRCAKALVPSIFPRTQGDNKTADVKPYGVRPCSEAFDPVYRKEGSGNATRNIQSYIVIVMSMPCPAIPAACSRFRRYHISPGGGGVARVDEAAKIRVCPAITELSSWWVRLKSASKYVSSTLKAMSALAAESTSSQPST